MKIMAGMLLEQRFDDSINDIVEVVLVCPSTIQKIEVNSVVFGRTFLYDNTTISKWSCDRSIVISWPFPTVVPPSISVQGELTFFKPNAH